MTNINNIIFYNFRNFEKCQILFEKNTNIFYGDNGSGKTNILEGISLLSKGRGLRNSQLNYLIQRGKKELLVKCEVQINKNNYDTNIVIKERDNKLKKIINVNNDATKDTLKFFNSSISFLTFLPEMERLFQSSPSNRRNFLDRLIFSYVSNYNSIINKYKKNLLERNKILQENNYDPNWINAVENEITKVGLQIYQFRKKQLQILNEYVSILNENNKYEFTVNFKIKDDFYFNGIKDEFYLKSLLNYRDHDKKFGGSKIGPHKSDLEVSINNDYDASQLSTGQQKTVVLMILLAQCNYLVKEKKINPILLLDEICSHLDANNRKLLLDMINSFDIQLFLTGTDKTMFSFISTNVKFCNITDL